MVIHDERNIFNSELDIFTRQVDQTNITDICQISSFNSAINLIRSFKNPLCSFFTQVPSIFNNFLTLTLIKLHTHQCRRFILPI